MHLDKESWPYAALRWAYQPLKLLKSATRHVCYVPRRSRLLRQHASVNFIGLHVGCGGLRLGGFLNTDLAPNPVMDFPLDICRPLPIPDNYFHAIYCSEVIEHIALKDCRSFLRESLRILRPGGILRLTTPDIYKVSQIYLHEHPVVRPAEFGTVWLDGEFSDEIWINAQFRSWGHLFLHSECHLRCELEKAGFADIVRVDPQVTRSRFPQLDNLENRYGKDAPTWIFDSTLLLEATKPQAVRVAPTSQATRPKGRVLASAT